MSARREPLSRAARRNAVVVILAIATSGALAAGFLLNVRDFLLNLLAEIAGLLFGGGLVVIFLHRYQRRQWRRTALITMTAIWRQIMAISDQAGSRLMLIKPNEMMPINERPSFSTSLQHLPPGAAAAVTEMKKVLAWMQTSQGVYNIGDDLPPGVSIEHRSSVELFGKITDPYLYLRDQVAPRVIARSDDETLTRCLFDLESKHLDWQGSVHAFPDDLMHPGKASFTWRPAIRFYEVLAETAAYIAPPLAERDPSGTDPERVEKLLELLDHAPRREHAGQSKGGRSSDTSTNPQTSSRTRDWPEAVAEAVVMLIVLGLMTICVVVGWLVGRYA